jgi:hypothetical protein
MPLIHDIQQGAKNQDENVYHMKHLSAFLKWIEA